MNMRSGKNTLRKTFKQQMHHEWYPTLQYLRGHPFHNRVGTDKLLAAWEELGTTTGLSEEQEKAEHAREAKKAAAQRAHHCAWKECKYHTVKHPMPTSLRACSGCGVVVRPLVLLHGQDQESTLPNSATARENVNGSAFLCLLLS